MKGTKAAEPPMIIRMVEVTKRTGLSRSTIYNKLDSKSSQFDPGFPGSIKIGRLSVGWIESEVNSWIGERVLDRDRRSGGLV